MIKYLITCRGDGTVLLENVSSSTGDKRSLQLTQAEFGLFLTNPNDTAAVMTERLWEQSDKTAGKAALRRTVDIAYAILGRENDA